MKNIVYNCDCMEYMKTCKDNEFDLAIVDPPYGVGMDGGNIGKSNYIKKEWDSGIPEKKYFQELFRISKNQIIWGGNYFIEYLKNTRCFIVWDKSPMNKEMTFSPYEVAWTNFNKNMGKFVFLWSGAYQGDMKNKENRIHPTQKPVALYRWLLDNYAKENDKIFDSHVGSGSSRIACYEKGFNFVGCELDKDYWSAQEKRFKVEKAKIDNEFYLPTENTLFE